jgi:hypothetical protein
MQHILGSPQTHWVQGTKTYYTSNKLYKIEESLPSQVSLVPGWTFQTSTIQWVLPTSGSTCKDSYSCHYFPKNTA